MHHSELVETVIDLIEKHNIEFSYGAASLSLIDNEAFRASSSGFYYDVFHYGMEGEEIAYALKEAGFSVNNSNATLEHLAISFIAALLHSSPNQKLILDWADAITNNNFTRPVYRSVLHQVKVSAKSFDFKHLDKDSKTILALNKALKLDANDWVEIIVDNDDSQLFESLVNAYEDVAEAKKAQKILLNKISHANQNLYPRLKRFIIGTDKSMYRNAVYNLLYPFRSDFDPTQYDNLSLKDMPNGFLEKHGGIVLADAFSQCLSVDFFKTTSNCSDEQAGAIADVLKLYIEKGVDWYKPWLASRTDAHLGALLDLESEYFTAPEQVKGVLTDQRLFNAAQGSRKFQLIKAFLTILPSSEVVNLFKDDDDLLVYCHKMTNNPKFLKFVKDHSKKTACITSDLSM